MGPGDVRRIITIEISNSGLSSSSRVVEISRSNARLTNQSTPWIVGGTMSNSGTARPGT